VNDMEQITYEALAKVALIMLDNKPLLDDNEFTALCYHCGMDWREFRCESINSGSKTTKERKSEWH